jgi:DNA-binding GntR family transcriptional regulator
MPFDSVNSHAGEEDPQTHFQIYRTLLKEILDGGYDAAQRLPSDAQLVRRFGVSRPTASRALRDLQSEGVIERRVGSGSYLTGVQSSTAEASRLSPASIEYLPRLSRRAWHTPLSDSRRGTHLPRRARDSSQ